MLNHRFFNKIFYGLFLIITMVLFPGAGFTDGLDFDAPELGAAPVKESGADISLGDFGGINFGGLFDVRYVSAGGKAPGTMIHVDELVVTANIGDNISILAEQLLPTSRLAGVDGVIGDDHGFVYAIFSNIPKLPAGTAFKIGRFRFKWGIDAVLDAPANPLYPLTRKNLGFITDSGLELSGFFGWLDYYIGLADGPEYKFSAIVDATGDTIGTAQRNVNNFTPALFTRFTTNPDLSSMFRFGLSYFQGKSWTYRNFMPVMPGARQRIRMPGGNANRFEIADRHHGAVDATVKLGKLDLNLEYSLGQDDLPMIGNVNTEGQYARLDYTIKPRKYGMVFQYDRYEDGRPGSTAELGISAALQVFIHDQAYIRAGYTYNQNDPSSQPDSLAEEDIGFLQFYLPF